MLELKAMSEEEFKIFQTRSQESYAAQMLDNENASFETLKAYAAEQFPKLVPLGLKTKNQYFFEAVETTSNESVGYLWLGTRQPFGEIVAAINDILIYEEFRQMGYGKQFIKLAQEKARQIGAKQIRLHVFNNNTVATSLYEGEGFAPTSQNLKKDL